MPQDYEARNKYIDGSHNVGVGVYKVSVYARDGEDEVKITI